MTVPTITDDQVAELEKIAASSDHDNIDVSGILVGIVRALLAERAELKRDAERYRWLRSRMVGVSFDWDDEGMVAIAFQMPPTTSFGANCDRNIDIAMQEQPS
ncbi:hypothetical protein ACVTMO_16830 [Pseudomonas segetis]